MAGPRAGGEIGRNGGLHAILALGRHCTGLATALDALVAILVVRFEIFKQLSMLLRNLVHLGDADEHGREVMQRLLVKVILVRLRMAV